MHLGYGLITAQRHPDDRRSWTDIYREAVDLAVEAERLGLDTVWTSEHHFVDDGYLPSQLPVLAAVSARTERIRLGTGVLLAPMFDPLHLAEDAATVDLLSNGRLILGLGIGWRDEEFEGLGGGDGHKGRRLEAIIEILRQAWSDGLVSGDRHGIYRYPEHGFNVTPKPAQPAGPPIWIGGGADAAVGRAGRLADGFISSRIAPAGLARRVELIREAATAAGRDPDAIELAVHIPTFAWRGEDPWDRVRPYAHYMSWKYDDMDKAFGSRERRSPPPLSPEDEEALRKRTIVGTPDQVVEAISAYRDVLGRDAHFVARAYFPGLDPAIQLETLRVFAEDVAPQLR